MSFLKAKTYKLKANQGFTLIELLVVIAIISLLSSIVLASLTTARNKAKDAAIKENLISVRTGAEIYLADNNSYGPPFPIASCPTILNAGFSKPMFNSTFYQSIFDAINQARSLSSSGNTLCFVDSTSMIYSMTIELNEVGSGATARSFFCIDNKNSARTLYTDSAGNPSIFNPDGTCRES